MNIRKLSSEKGQSLVLVALLFLAFAAILALVLDGGSAYAARRQAQNAADAGALAGASFMCEHRDAAGGVTKAEDFAVLNGAVDPPDVYANLNTGSVVVTATVQKDTFFAGLIGVPQVSPRAVAEAKCSPAAPVGVLPVAWSCRERAGDPDLEPLPGDECAEKYKPAIYILMDSVKVRDNKKGGKCKNPDITDPTDPNYCYTENDLVCSIPKGPPPGCTYDPITSPGIDCDLDDDCINELMAGGARSWLDLDGGGGGASELRNWIKNGFPNVINPHTWLPEQSGVATSIFKDASTVVGKDVYLPVFNKICDKYPDISVPDADETNEACTYADPLDDLTKASNNMNFHVIAFSKFHVTCVQTSKNKATDETGKLKSCPGHDFAASVSIEDNDKTIEGYFIKGPIYGYGGPGGLFDVGTFVVVLVR